MQNGFCHPEGSFTRMGADTGAFQSVVPQVAGLCDASRDLGMQIIFVRQSYRRNHPEAGLLEGRAHPWIVRESALGRDDWDSQVVSGIAVKGEDLVVVKPRYDAFLWTDLDLLLRRLAVTDLIVSGVSTNVCVESTVRSAAQRDYAVTVAADAVAATSLELHRAALTAMSYAFATVADWKDIEVFNK